jgi:rhodanese-related sulfurtransferase
METHAIKEHSLMTTNLNKSRGVGSTHTESLHTDLHAVLLSAREQANRDLLEYAGTLSPQLAWPLFQAGIAKIVDVRSAEELHFVGHVPDTLHVPWANGVSLNRNPRFIGQLGSKVSKDDNLLFLCRSGKRSALAAQAATRAGYQNAFNISEGFEGDIDQQQRRGSLGGWRFHGLPWIQD